MQHWMDSLKDRAHKARRFEWVGFGFLLLLSLAVTAASYAATGWLV